MASQLLFLHAVLFSLLLVSHAQTNTQSVTLYKMEARSSIHVSSVTLQCSVGTGVQGNRTFYREVNGLIERVTNGTENVQILTFQLWPSAEGNYYCQVGEVESNRILVLAYPVLDKRITSTKLAPVSLSDTVCVPCAYQRGRIDDRQQDVVWYKGMDRVNPSVSQFSRYEILRNFTLMIRDVKSSDASDAYYCQVNVTTFNETVTKQAPLISVTVLDPIEITQPIQERIITLNRVANFPCKISGVPKPTIKWLFNGRELVNSTTSRLTQYRNELRNILTVTSEMDIRASLGSGRVTCVGYHIGEEGRMVVVSSEANLVVLTDNLRPQLLQSSEGAMLDIQFPSVIPGQFDIVVYYKYQDKYSRRVISHPTFRNTNQVNIAIPLDKLPNFRTFSVQVALSVANNTGGMSVESNQITISEYPPNVITDTDCSCTSVAGVKPAGSDSVVVGVLSFFIVLVIIGIIVMIIFSVLVFICCKRMKVYTANKEIEQYDNEGGHFSSEDHVSKTTPSYENIPGPSNKNLRKTSVSSYNGNEAGGESSEEEDDAADNRSHKRLQQWDDNNKAVDIDEPVKVDETNIDDTTVDDETGIRVSSKDFAQYIPPKVRGRGELPYVTNPALMHRARENNNSKMKPSESTSSFEDLQDECEEFTAEAPRTM